MSTGSFAHRLRCGEILLGTLMVSTSARFFDAMLGHRPDFVFLDTEHITYNPETLAWMCRAFRVAGIAPLVRILSPDPHLAAQAIDAGAIGIVAPYIEEVEEVVALVGAVKHRPLKGRLLRDRMRGDPVKPEIDAYLEAGNRDRALLINIESPAAIANLDELLAISGLDGVIVGPHDLSVAAGMPEDYGNPRFRAIVDGIIRTARKRGLAAGCHSGFANGLDEQMGWMRSGANLVLHSADLIFFQEQAQRDFGALRSALGMGTPEQATTPDRTAI